MEQLVTEIEEYALEARAVLERWRTDPERGLSDDVAEERLSEFGPNRLEEVGRIPPWRQFADQFTDFIVLVLIGAALVSGLLQEWMDAMAIVVIVILNAILGFIQEYRAERALEA